MVIFPLSRKKTNAYIRKLRPSKSGAGAGFMPRNIFGSRGNLLEIQAKI